MGKKFLFLLLILTTNYFLFAGDSLKIISSKSSESEQISKRIYTVMGTGYRHYFIRPWKKNSPYAIEIPKLINNYLKLKNGYSKNLRASKGGKILDLLYILNWGYRVRKNIKGDRRSMRFIKDLRRDFKQHPFRVEEQLNIVAISQGTVPTVQASIAIFQNLNKYKLPSNFKIDNLVLVGCPISKESELYKELIKLEGIQIKKIHYDNYQTDGDIITGISGTDRKQAWENAKKFLSLAFSKSTNNRKVPHFRAALNLPLPDDSACICTFSEQLRDKLIKDSIL